MLHKVSVFKFQGMLPMGSSTITKISVLGVGANNQEGWPYENHSCGHNSESAVRFTLIY